MSPFLPTARSSLRGFTLIELLVVIGIIGLLAALLLPAVQQAREAARRTTCKNNLKQLGLALQLYHDQFSSFPPGWLGFQGNVADPQGETGFSWGSMILPFLDQQPLHSRIDFNVAMDAAVNRAPVGEFLPVFSCPSDPIPSKFVIGTRDGESITLPTANYAALFGTTELDECDNPPGTPPVSAWGQCIGNGVFYHNSAVRMAMIEDGTSQTLLLGERTTFNDEDGVPFYGTWPGALPEVDEAVERVLAHIEDPPNTNPHPGHFGSVHSSGGAHFVLADGHVVFISTMIDRKTLEALGTRSGKEIVGSY